MVWKLNTPVLYLTFNRLDSVKKTFPGIAKQEPPQLFIACDGPRNLKEKRKTDAVRKYILDNINWKCEVKTLFRKNNLGCKKAVSGAIDWFFKNVEAGIILEDDCLADVDFFRFCEELLLKYKNNKKIMSISGINYLRSPGLKAGNLQLNESYYFSKYFICAGWATWRRAWKMCDVNMENYSKYKLKKLFPGFLERIKYKKRLDDNISCKIDSWATSFFWTHIINKGLAIIPSKNLIENIGFRNGATNTGDKIDAKMFFAKKEKLNFPLKHPIEIKRNKRLDDLYVRKDLKRVIFKKGLSIFS